MLARCRLLAYRPCVGYRGALKAGHPFGCGGYRRNSCYQRNKNTPETIQSLRVRARSLTPRLLRLSISTFPIPPSRRDGDRGEMSIEPVGAALAALAALGAAAKAPSRF